MNANKMSWYQIAERVNAGTSIRDIPLSVAFYGRVSTEKEYQLHSLENSNEYLEKYIAACENWTLYRGYVDEGISGTSADKRDEFLRMIEDAERGCFSLIVTKEVSRFARNNRECLNYIKRLKDSNVGVLFLNDNILSFRDQDNFSLHIRGVIAEEESRNTSRRVAFGHQQSIRKGTVFGNGLIYGYDKVPGGLAVNEAEAEMVRRVFEMYAGGGLSLHQIELALDKMGYKNSKGNRISHVTLGAIITNPKYKGYYCGNKVKVIDMQTRKQKFLDESEWVMYKDETGEKVPAIVDEALWEQANERYRQRKAKYKAIREKGGAPAVGWGRSPLSGKLFCAACGAPFWRDVVSFGGTAGKEYWRCSFKKKNGAASCPTSPIYAEELLEILKSVFVEMKAAVTENAREYVRLLREEFQDVPESAEKDVKRLGRQLEQLYKKRDKLLDHNVNGRISDEQFEEMNGALAADIQEVTSRINEAKDSMASVRASMKKADQLCRQIVSFFSGYDGQGLDADTAAMLVDRIEVFPTEGREIPLKIHLRFADEPREARIERRRSGNMVKKMIESQERQMSGQTR
ncbi:MAG: recombinase family protein [Clostridia bacterium]|nr:recombinase family protein [Clostridia bacterium]